MYGQRISDLGAKDKFRLCAVNAHLAFRENQRFTKYWVEKAVLRQNSNMFKNKSSLDGND